MAAHSASLTVVLVGGPPLHPAAEGAALRTPRANHQREEGRRVHPIPTLWLVLHLPARAW